MRILAALCTILTLAIAPFTTLAQKQEYTTAQVVAKLDEKAKAFSSLEASIQKTGAVYGVKSPPSSGKIYMKMVNSSPRILLDITAPKEELMTALIKDGKATVFFKTTNSYREGKVDSNSEAVQLLLIGFGVPSATFTKSYKPEVKGLEAIDGVQAVVLDLSSVSPLTANFSKITLWLDPQMWIPLQTRVTEKSKDFTDFKYSKVSLNKKLSDSVFQLKIPSTATKQ
jgi:outer membrane lipoprotein-sorting protein